MNRPSKSQDDYDPRRGHNQDDYAAWVKSLLYPRPSTAWYLALMWCEPTMTSDKYQIWFGEDYPDEI